MHCMIQIWAFAVVSTYAITLCNDDDDDDEKKKRRNVEVANKIVELPDETPRAQHANGTKNETPHNGQAHANGATINTAE